MRPDVVVVGGGMSGLAASVRLAEEGAAVLVLAKGAGSLQLAPGTIDLLGYAGGERVTEPLAAIAELAGREPGHPYSLLGPDSVGDAARWLSSRVADGPLANYRYVGRPEENMLLPTAVGVPRPSALVPETMAAGDLRREGRVVVVGFRGMKDFHPALLADNLNRTGGAVSARALQIDPPEALGGEPGTLRLAHALERPGAAAALGARLAAVVQDDEVLALPAVLSIGDPHGVWETLQASVGARVCEIPTLPPSVPGLRLFNTLRALLRRAGGRLVTGSYAVGAKGAGDRVDAVRVHVSGGERSYPTRWVVLATGGVASGGIELGADWRMRETALGLDVAGVPAPGAARFTSRYLDSHPISRAGIAVDRHLRALDARGRRRWENVLVVGAALAGAEPWREKSGEGIALASGHRAAQLILDAERGIPETTASTTVVQPIA